MISNVTIATPENMMPSVTLVISICLTPFVEIILEID
jgi:hypothetical protein